MIIYYEANFDELIVLKILWLLYKVERRKIVDEMKVKQT